MPEPRKDPAADENENENERNQDEDEQAQTGGNDGGDDAEKPDMDLSIEIEDASGQTARLTLGEYGAIRRPLETYVMRRADREASRFERNWELILQTYSIPLEDFVARNRSLALSRLAVVRFVFDQVHVGEVSIDRIGFSDLDPAFLSARVDGP